LAASRNLEMQPVDSNTISPPVTISAFLQEAFCPASIPATERICIGVGEGGMKSVSGTARNIAKLEKEAGTTELYVCLSTVAEPESRASPLRRRAEDIRYAYLLVFDDIGTKSTAPPVEPSYKLQTSIKAGKANFQWGYFLSAFDVSTPEGRAYFDGCLIAAAGAGWNDPGLRSASRIVRLPGALHKSGFVAEITDWHPERVWDLPELMAELGLDPENAALAPPVSREGAITDLTQIDDPVFDWLQSQGLYVGPSGNGFFDIVCPWADAHTDSRVEAGYSPLNYGVAGRQFHCLHGHCQDKRTGEFLSWVEATGGPSESGLVLAGAGFEAFKAAVAGIKAVPWSSHGPGSGFSGSAPIAAPLADTVKEALERFVYSANQQTWIDTANGLYANGLTLKAHIQNLMPMGSGRPRKRRAPEEVWFENPARVTVIDKLWNPGEPKGVVQFMDADYWNTYEPYTPPGRYDAAVAQAFHDHILDTFGPDGVWLEQWLGWAAQNPSEKILWSPLLVGVQGDGKSLLADALGLAVGPGRLHKGSTTAVTSNFNDFLEGKLVLAIEELRVSGQNRHMMMDKLKDVVTNTSIEIRPKGLKNRTAPNFVNVLAMTNHLDALPLDNSDRRWAVFTSRFILGDGDLRKERLETGYFDLLMDSLRNDPEAVVGWLRAIDVSAFNPKSRAPDTTAKADMILDAGGENESEILHLIATRTGVGLTPYAFTMPALRAQLRLDGYDDEPNKVAAVLRHAGFAPLKMPVRLGAQQFRVWFSRAHYGRDDNAAAAKVKADLDATSVCTDNVLNFAPSKKK